MSYGYVGAPALFNGTLPNGGDSGMYHSQASQLPPIKQPPLTHHFLAHSQNKPQPMVPIRRLGLHHNMFLHGPNHDPGHRLPLLRPRPPQIRVNHDLGRHGLLLHHHLPMVPVGLQPGLLQQRHLRLHRQPRPLRLAQRAGRTESREPAGARVAL